MSTFWAKILAWASFQAKILLSVKYVGSHILTNYCPQKVALKSQKEPFWDHKYFQFLKKVNLVPGKITSNEHWLSPTSNEDQRNTIFFSPQKKRNKPNRELPIINYGTETIKVVLLLFLRIYEINGGSKIASTGRYRPQEGLQGTPEHEFGILLCATFAFKIPPSGVHSLASLADYIYGRKLIRLHVILLHNMTKQFY